MSPNYLFTSKRLGFRNWEESDLPALTAMNMDPEVMEYFPDVLTQKQSLDFLLRMQRELRDNGYCYFATDLLSNGELIGMIGMSIKNFEADFTPCTDIGWRLARPYWGKGYATEGAQRCLDYAFDNLELSEIYCIASEINIKSVNVMAKIGLEQAGSFDHPALLNNDRLRRCVLYKGQNPALKDGQRP